MNFKGIKNLGYEFDEAQAKVDGFGGQNFGIDKYLGFDFKLLYQSYISPFIFMNYALLPNKAFSREDIED